MGGGDDRLASAHSDRRAELLVEEWEVKLRVDGRVTLGEEEFISRRVAELSLRGRRMVPTVVELLSGGDGREGVGG